MTRSRVLRQLKFSAVVAILYDFIFIYDGTLVNLPEVHLPETRCMLHHPVDSGPFPFIYQNNQKTHQEKKAAYSCLVENLLTLRMRVCLWQGYFLCKVCKPRQCLVLTLR